MKLSEFSKTKLEGPRLQHRQVPGLHEGGRGGGGGHHRVS